jgi:hypothetical protein
MKLRIIKKKNLNEITKQQVIDTFNLESKKFRRRFLNILKKVSEIDSIVRIPEDEEEIQSFLQEHIMRFKYLFDVFTRPSPIPEDITPAQQGAAANWLKNVLLNEPKDYLNLVLESEPHAISMVSTNIEKFFQMQDFIPAAYPKDINQYANLNELEEVVNTTIPYYRHHQKKKAYLDAEQGMDKIGEDRAWEIYIPRNKGAACELGKGTDWCTAAPGLDYYEEYHSDDDPLIVFVSKQDPKDRYQFHYGTEQYMDNEDVPVATETFLHLHRILIDNAEKELPKIVTNKIVFNWDDTFSSKVVDPGADMFDPYVAEWLLIDPENSQVSGRHRTDGPAYVEFAAGPPDKCLWYFRGLRVARMKIKRSSPDRAGVIMALQILSYGTDKEAAELKDVGELLYAKRYYGPPYDKFDEFTEESEAYKKFNEKVQERMQSLDIDRQKKTKTWGLRESKSSVKIRIVK